MTTPALDEKVRMATPSAGAPTGLTEAEADRRRKSYGENTIADVGAHPLRRALDKFWSPVPWMLEGAIVLEFALGKFVEGAVIALLLVFIFRKDARRRRSRP